MLSSNLKEVNLTDDIMLKKIGCGAFYNCINGNANGPDTARKKI